VCLNRPFSRRLDTKVRSASNRTLEPAEETKIVVKVLVACDYGNAKWRTRSTVEALLLADLNRNLNRHELGDAPGISQRVDDILGSQFPHEQCQIPFGGCLDVASIDALHVLRGVSATNHLHQKFGVLHSLLCCLEVLLRKTRSIGAEGVRERAQPFFNCG